MKKMVIFISLLFFVAAMPLVAQDIQKIPFVDIASANEQIETLTSQNQELQTSIDELESTNKTLEQEVIALQSQLRNLLPILDSVKRKAGELYSVNAGIVDAEMKAKSQDAIARNRELQGRLETKEADLNKEINTKLDQIDKNRSNVRIAQSKIDRNEDTIVILQASIEKTQNQKTTLDSYINSVNSFLNDAESVLQ